MNFIAGHTYHVFNQGNNRREIFPEKENYLFFLKKMKEQLHPYSDILAWCLMPNHYHFLLKVRDDYDTEYGRNLNRSIGTLQSSYTRAINKRYDQSGSLFRQKAKSKSVEAHSIDDPNYGINCFLYIHQNPVRAGLVNKLEDWKFSSYRDFIGMRGGKLVNKELALSALGLPFSMEDFIRASKHIMPEKYTRNFLRENN